MTVKKFMLKKFPTNEYMDCPVPKHHWETIQEYATAYAEHILSELLERPDLLIDAVQNENTDHDARSLVELVESVHK